MKDLNSLMQQAQGMQQKLQDAQAKLAETTAEGQAGGGLVKLVLKGSGALVSVSVDDSLLTPGEGEIVGDLLVAAHADAKAKLDAAQEKAMTDAMGPMAGLMGGMPGMPRF
ncbi:MAG: YbaB/EbfC family nucleoid-associated protein [Caulobacteraceae bacterium]|nr:YbaB/EbfC family nucleoid-associated protein [Caulobacter sp.]